MPVTVKPCAHGTDVIKGSFAKNTREVLASTSTQERWQRGELLQSSMDAEQMPPHLQSAKNGLFQAALNAYSFHHHLVLRPEDFWFAILTQFSIYVTQHAEELRHHFVAHEGKKPLEIAYKKFDRHDLDYADFATKMGELIQENILDPELQDWMQPDFSTTTDNDRVVASILMMGAMQQYFQYYCRAGCGLPSVKLLGEKSDYELILTRLDKLDTFGEEPAQFCRLLKPVIRRLIATFEDPSDAAVLDFWRKILDVNRGSGFCRYSGWMTAFCFWSDTGSCLYNSMRREDPDTDYNQKAYGVLEIKSSDGENLKRVMLNLELDGVRYHKVNRESVPSGWCSVPVTLVEKGRNIDSEMIAGSIGVNCSGSGKALPKGKPELDTMQPQTGWWMFARPNDPRQCM